jgi:hypothetical protein
MMTVTMIVVMIMVVIVRSWQAYSAASLGASLGGRSATSPR